MYIGSNIQMSLAKHRGGIFNHKTCAKRRKVCNQCLFLILIDR